MTFTPAQLMRLANINRGMDSLALMPIKSGVNFTGKVLERFGLKSNSGEKLGDELIGKYMLSPTESFTHGVGSALGEIPLFGRLFKYKLRPDDVALASRSGANMSNSQFRKLVNQANMGELYTHRLTAPFESKGMYTLVLPMLAGSYIQDQVKKDKSPEQLELEKRDSENLNLFNKLLGKNDTLQEKTGGIDMNTGSQEQISRERLLLQAADKIDSLTGIVKQASIEIREANARAASAESELALYKKAVDLITDGRLDSSMADEFVKQARSNNNTHRTQSQPVDLTDLFSSTQSVIPKHAENTMTLHEPHGGFGGNDYSSNGSGVQKRTQSARSGFDDFVLG